MKKVPLFVRQQPSPTARQAFELVMRQYEARELTHETGEPVMTRTEARQLAYRAARTIEPTFGTPTILGEVSYV